MPYQDEQRRQQPPRAFGDYAAVTAGAIPKATKLPQPQVIAAPSNPLLAGARATGAVVNAGIDTAVAGAKDIGKNVLALATGNDPRTRPGGLLTDSRANVQAVGAKLAASAAPLLDLSQRAKAAGAEISGARPAAPQAAAPAVPARPRAAPKPGGALPGASAVENTPDQRGGIYRAGNRFSDQAIAGGVNIGTPQPTVTGPGFAENTAGFVDAGQRASDAQLRRRDALIDSEIARANRSTALNALENQQRGTTGRARGGFVPRGTTARRQELATTQAQLATAPNPLAELPTAAAGQVDAAQVQQAQLKTQADQLALAAEQRKAALAQQIAQLPPGDPNAQTLLTNLAVLSGRNPNEGRFEGVEEVIGYDQFGTPQKARSLYDTREGKFIDRGVQAQAKPTQEEAIADAKSRVKAGADKAAINARLKALGYPEI